jgi:hypothetical protein
MHRPDKIESRRIRVDIRHVLLETWDSIGVRDEPYAQDEYDMYIGDVYELLVRQASEDEIEKYLLWVATERMGFTQWQVNSKNAKASLALRQIPLSQS